MQQQEAETDGSNTTKEPTPPSSWWNAECDRLIRMRKVALCSSCIRENFINYKKAEAKARNGLKIKNKPFINFTRSLTRFTNPSYVWSKIKASRTGGTIATMPMNIKRTSIKLGR
jgi:hypothetical protein